MLGLLGFAPGIGSVNKADSGGYLPANGLIGELLHPIELLLHLGSFASPVFRGIASEPRALVCHEVRRGLSPFFFSFLSFFFFFQAFRYDREKQARAIEAQSQLKIVRSLR